MYFVIGARPAASRTSPHDPGLGGSAGGARGLPGRSGGRGRERRHPSLASLAAALRLVFVDEAASRRARSGRRPRQLRRDAALLGTQYGARRWWVVATATVADPLIRLVAIVLAVQSEGLVGAAWAAVGRSRSSSSSSSSRFAGPRPSRSIALPRRGDRRAHGGGRRRRGVLPDQRGARAVRIVAPDDTPSPSRLFVSSSSSSVRRWSWVCSRFRRRHGDAPRSRAARRLAALLVLGTLGQARPWRGRPVGLLESRWSPRSRSILRRRAQRFSSGSPSPPVRRPRSSSPGAWRWPRSDAGLLPGTVGIRDRGDRDRPGAARGRSRAHDGRDDRGSARRSGGAPRGTIARIVRVQR